MTQRIFFILLGFLLLFVVIVVSELAAFSNDNPTYEEALIRPIRAAAKCKKGGVWSKYKLYIPCRCPPDQFLKSQGVSRECGGSCEHTLTRNCTSKAKGCPCKGSATLTKPCNIQACVAPLKPCFPGLKVKKVKGKSVCG